MVKMWSKGRAIDPLVERYTVGDDPQVDTELVGYEIAATRAHCAMLAEMGILTAEEIKSIGHALDELDYMATRGEFKIQPDEEDCHSALENFLVSRVGEAAFKVHIFRSRNEQVLNIVRLYCRDMLEGLVEKLGGLKDALEKCAARYEKVAMPGYTHSQRAMPTTAGVWLGSFASLVEDDIVLASFVRGRINRCPLGSAAGFGTSHPIDRKLLAEKLGYESVQENPLSCQNGRGKETQTVLFALTQVAATLGKLAADCLLFTTEEFDFLSLDDSFLTGSSIMPNKRNYDLFEITRARAADIYASLVEVFFIDKGLTSGYHRDFQMFKKPLINAFSSILKAVEVMIMAVPALRLNEERLKQAVADERLYATQKATEMALKDKIPYRRAYFKVKEELGEKDE